MMIYIPNGLMRYNNSVAIVDDMPLLSQWIKKSKSKDLDFFGTLKGIFPHTTVCYRLANARYPRALQPFTERLQFVFSTNRPCSNPFLHIKNNTEPTFVSTFAYFVAK